MPLPNNISFPLDLFNCRVINVESGVWNRTNSDRRTPYKPELYNTYTKQWKTHRMKSTIVFIEAFSLKWCVYPKDTFHWRLIEIKDAHNKINRSTGGNGLVFVCGWLVFSVLSNKFSSFALFLSLSFVVFRNLLFLFLFAFVSTFVWHLYKHKHLCENKSKNSLFSTFDTFNKLHRLDTQYSHLLTQVNPYI